MKMKAIVAIAVLAVVGSACGDAVSLNWKEFAGGVNDVLDGWGVESADNWQNLQKVMTGTDVVLSSGAASTIEIPQSRTTTHRTQRVGRTAAVAESASRRPRALRRTESRRDPPSRNRRFRPLATSDSPRPSTEA